jgi:cytosine/uracil/thiamine/allantoin permease
MKSNKLEIIGFIIMAIGAILMMTQKLNKIEALTKLFEFNEIILYAGLAIWAIGLIKRDNDKKKKKKKKKEATEKEN